MHGSTAFLRSSDIVRRARRLVALGAALVVTLTADGCSDVEPVTPYSGPVTDATALYMALTIDHPAVTLSTAAPYNTLQLTAAPRDALSHVMAGLPAPVFRSSDTSTVLVSPDGMVTGVHPATAVKVIAELTAGAVRHVDTAYVNVNDASEPPRLASLSIDPVPPDSGKWPIVIGDVGLIGVLLADGSGIVTRARPRLTPVVIDSTGNVVSGLPIEYASLDPTIATVDRRSGGVTLLQPGVARFTARTTAYGVTRVDTAAYTLTMPLYRQVYVRAGPTGSPIFSAVGGLGFDQSRSEIRVRPGGFVLWVNGTADSADVTFDDPTNVVSPIPSLCTYLTDNLGPDAFCGDGSVLVPANPDLSDQSGFALYFTIRIRQFPVPGTYHYHSNRLGVVGDIVVGDTAD